VVQEIFSMDCNVVHVISAVWVADWAVVWTSAEWTTAAWTSAV